MRTKIMIADDEPNIRKLLKFNFEKAGFIVIEAIDGIDCLNKLQIEKPELIILDLMMPGKGGVEVCRAIKGNPKTEHITIIMLTAKEKGTDILRCLEIGAVDCVYKPFSPRELIVRINNVIEKNRIESYSGKLSNAI